MRHADRTQTTVSTVQSLGWVGDVACQDSVRALLANRVIVRKTKARHSWNKTEWVLFSGVWGQVS